MRACALSMLLVIAAGCQIGNGGGGGGGGSSFGGGPPPPQGSAATTGNANLDSLRAKQHADAGKHDSDEDAGETRARDAGPNRAH